MHFGMLEILDIGDVMHFAILEILSTCCVKKF